LKEHWIGSIKVQKSESEPQFGLRRLPDDKADATSMAKTFGDLVAGILFTALPLIPTVSRKALAGLPGSYPKSTSSTFWDKKGVLTGGKCLYKSISFGRDVLHLITQKLVDNVLSYRSFLEFRTGPLGY
jgi:hypothetical protein